MAREVSATVDRRAARRHDTREAILTAAWDLAAEHGIAGLSLRELARRVGMRAPSLYSYFDSKDAIYDAMFADAYRQLDERWDAWQVGGGDAEAMTDAMEHWLGFCLENVPRYQLMYTHVVPGWHPSPEAMAVSVRSYERFRREMRALGIEDDSHLDLWTAIASGLAAQQIANDPDGDRWVRLVRPAVEMFLAATRRTSNAKEQAE